jgi:hypothetical protein
MAIVQGIREKVHLPLYDSLFVEPEKQLRDVERSSTLKFFVNVQNKTRLETNLQSASLLPHYNTFEARAMRVVISDLAPVFPDDVVESDDEAFEEYDVVNEDGESIGVAGTVVNTDPEYLTANLEIDLATLMGLLKEARESEDGDVFLSVDDEEVLEVLNASESEITDPEYGVLSNAGAGVYVTVADLEAMITSLKEKSPPEEQIRTSDGAAGLISKLIYNTVTTFYVGEKVMIEMPTFFFPGGCGASTQGGKTVSHGEPNPLATFRFAEPIFIDRQQNFRVEIEVPDADTLKDIQKIYGPFNIWVVLDGYMTRGVQ